MAKDDRSSRRMRQAGPADAGFTLVEILIVVFIIGLMSAVVVVNLPASRPAVVVQADGLARDLERASREAIVSGEPIALSVQGGQYRFERYRGGFWSPAGAVSGAREAGTGAVEIEVRRAGDRDRSRRHWATNRNAEREDGDAFQRQVVFSAVGDATPAEIIISGEGQRLVIEVSASGEIRRVADTGAPVS